MELLGILSAWECHERFIVTQLSSRKKERNTRFKYVETVISQESLGTSSTTESLHPVWMMQSRGDIKQKSPKKGPMYKGLW